MMFRLVMSSGPVMSFVEPLLVSGWSSECTAPLCIGLGATTYEQWLGQLSESHNRAPRQGLRAQSGE